DKDCLAGDLASSEPHLHRGRGHSGSEHRRDLDRDTRAAVRGVLQPVLPRMPKEPACSPDLKQHTIFSTWLHPFAEISLPPLFEAPLPVEFLDCILIAALPYTAGAVRRTV